MWADFPSMEVFEDAIESIFDCGPRADAHGILRTRRRRYYGHVGDIEGVMRRGRWLPRIEIQDQLDRFASDYAGE